MFKSVASKTFLLLSAVVLASPQAQQRDSTQKEIREHVTVEGLDGRTIEMVQVLVPNPDNTFTVIALEPEHKVREFFQQQCQTIGADWPGLDQGETRITEEAIYGFSCVKNK